MPLEKSEPHARVNYTVSTWITQKDLARESRRADVQGEDLIRHIADHRVDEAAAMHGMDWQFQDIDHNTLDFSALSAAGEPELDVDAALARSADKNNPAQQMSNNALKMAKKLSDVLNTLAGMNNREEIAQVGGLQQLQEQIERLYELADRLRAGGVTALQPAYAGWDPDKIRLSGGAAEGDFPEGPGVDDTQHPMAVYRGPATQYRFEREQTSCPYCVDTPMDAQ